MAVEVNNLKYRPYSIHPRERQFKNADLLAAGATYTSPLIDSINFRRLTGFVNADQPGDIIIKESDDGSRFYTTKTISVTANEPNKFDEVANLRYFRVEFNNTGASAQADFYIVAYSSIGN